LNISIVGPNAAGKSFLVRRVISDVAGIYPFSISNFPQEKPRFKFLRAGDIAERRISELLGKWGPCYNKALYDSNKVFIIEEGLLTKTLAKCPTDFNEASKFETTLRKYFPKISEIESSYVDKYFLVSPSIQDWLLNRSRRNDSFILQDTVGNRFMTQKRLLENYLEYYLRLKPNSIISSYDEMMMLIRNFL
jgi:hypothetical protein